LVEKVAGRSSGNANFIIIYTTFSYFLHFISFINDGLL